MLIAFVKGPNGDRVSVSCLSGKDLIVIAHNNLKSGEEITSTIDESDTDEWVRHGLNGLQHISEQSMCGFDPGFDALLTKILQKGIEIGKKQ